SAFRTIQVCVIRNIACMCAEFSDMRDTGWRAAMSVRKRKWKTAKGVECEAWIVDYVDQSGDRRLKTFGTKKEADAWSVAARHEVLQGTHTPESKSITVAEAAEDWI